MKSPVINERKGKRSRLIRWISFTVANLVSMGVLATVAFFCGWARFARASVVVPIGAPLAFTANDCLDFGIDLGSPVGLEYYDQAPFRFNGMIEQARVEYIQ
jgi:hypothetical protein